VGDRSSDIHVMLHLNRQDGLAVAVSEPKHVSHIAKRTVLATSRSPLSCRDRAQPNDGVFRAGLLPQLDGWMSYRTATLTATQLAEKGSGTTGKIEGRYGEPTV
jgi:hypothetical protein